MNEGDSHLHPWIEPELEARIIALVLGEASDFEAEELERLIGEKPELAMFRDRMEAIHGLLHEVAEGEPEDADETWKLPKGRRETVLAAIEGRKAEPSLASETNSESDSDSGDRESREAIVEAVPEKVPGRKPQRRKWIQTIGLSAAAALILFVGLAALMPSKLGLISASRAPADMALARPEEDYGYFADSKAEGIPTIEEIKLRTVSPQRIAGQAGEALEEVESLFVRNDGTAADGVALSYDSKSKASSSFSRLNETMAAFPVTPAAPGLSESDYDDPQLPPLVASTKGAVRRGETAPNFGLQFPADAQDTNGRFKRQSAEGMDFGQVGGTYVGPAKSPAPMPSAKPAPAPEPMSAPAAPNVTAAPVAGQAPAFRSPAETTVEDGAAIVMAVPAPRGAILAAPTLGKELRRKRESDLAQMKVEKLDRLSVRDSRVTAERDVEDKIPLHGDLPVSGKLFKKNAEADQKQPLTENAPAVVEFDGIVSSAPAPANSAVELRKKMTDLTAPLPVQDENRFDNFENGMGNSVDSPSVNKPGEGNAQSLSGANDGLKRQLLGVSRDLRGFDSITVAPNAADSPEQAKRMGFDFKSNDRKLEFPSAGEPAPMKRPVLAEGRSDGLEREKLHKGHGQVAAIRIEGSDKTVDEVVHRELEVDNRDAVVSESLQAAAQKVSSDDALALGEIKLIGDAEVDASGAMGGENANIGGGFQGRNAGDRAGGRVTLDAPGGAIAVSNAGSIRANGANGSGGEVLADGEKESSPMQSLAAIKDVLRVAPDANGNEVDSTSFSVRAVENTSLIQPGEESRGLNRVMSGNPNALHDTSNEFLFEDFSRSEFQTAVPSADSIASSEVTAKQAAPSGFGRNDTKKSDAWYFKSGEIMPEPDNRSENAVWATPMAGGDIDRNLATTHPAPAAAEGEEARDKEAQWDSQAGTIVSDDIAFTDPASRADIDVALSGGVLQQSGGRHDSPVQIGHGGRTSGLASGATRQWQEGFARNQGSVGDTYAIDLNLTPEVVEFAGFINYGSSLDGDSIDGLVASDAAKDYYVRSQEQTRANFQRGVNEGWELPVPVAARGGQREKTEVTREFIYPTEYDPPEIPAKIALKKRVAAPSGLEEKSAAEESFSTFSLHVSDVSFKLAQAALAKGEWPEAGKVRIEEFVNAFDYGDPNPSQEDKVACRVEQAIHPFLQQRNLMRVAMRTAAAGRAGDTPLRLTFLLDNSGSMERADREETVRRAFALLADQLQPIDQVTLISFARQPRLLADKVSGDKSSDLVDVVANLPSEGGTNLEAALKLAFEKAQEQKADNAQNRIVLLTDGAANLGNAKPESLSRMVESMREEGVAFDAAGIGAEGLNDDILEALTRKGDGRYYLLDRPEDADDGFARQIAGALRPAAKNVKVQVEFNPDRVGNYKLLGFEKHLLKKEDFRDDTVDAAEMAAEEAGVAVYQFEAKPDGKGDVGFVSVRFRDMSSGEMVEKRWPIPYEPSAPRPDQAAPSMQIATAAALLAAKLNSEPLGETVDLEELARTVSSLPESFQNKERVQQLRQMIDQARELAAK